MTKRRSLQKKGRRGRAIAPYTKYKKVPYKYSKAYYDWAAGRINNEQYYKMRDREEKETPHLKEAA